MMLSRLYKSLGHFDVVRGIFSGHIGTKPITKEALEAEQRMDYFEALHSYRDVRKGRREGAWQGGEREKERHERYLVECEGGVDGRGG